MRQITAQAGFASQRPRHDQDEQEALIQGRFRPGQYQHTPLPWQMARDGRNRAWLVDAHGVRVHLHPGNIKLILRALEAYKGDGT